MTPVSTHAGLVAPLVGVLEQRIADITRRQAAPLRRARDVTDHDDPSVHGLRAGYDDLDTDTTTALAAVADLDAADAAEPTRPDGGGVTLLDQLSFLRLTLAQAPEPLLRTLFEATRLIDLHEHGDDACPRGGTYSIYKRTGSAGAYDLNEGGPASAPSARRSDLILFGGGSRRWGHLHYLYTPAGRPCWSLEERVRLPSID